MPDGAGPSRAISSGDARGTRLVPRLRSEVHENWVEAAEWVARIAPGAVVDRGGGLTIVRTGLPRVFYNAAFALEPVRSVDGFAERIRRILARGEAPWRLDTTYDTVEALAPVIAELGLERGRVGVFMTRGLEDLPAAVPPGDLVVDRVSGPEGMPTFVSANMDGFEVARASWVDEVTELYASRFREITSNIGFYIGYAKGRPVTTGLLCITGRVAGVYNLSTLPEFRRRGYGETLTFRLLKDGRERGCSIAFLDATDVGRPLYEKMGFCLLEEPQVWRPRTPSP